MELPIVSRKKYNEVVYKLECLLCHATGGRLSKHSYTLQTMTSAVTDYINESCYEAAADAIEDYEKYTEETDGTDT